MTPKYLHLLFLNPMINYGNDIPLYTTFHLNQTFYTLYHTEPHSVILNEVKDLHTQFRVSCPGRK